MIESLGQVSSADGVLQREMERFAATTSRQREIAFCFDVDCYWLDEPASTTLLAVCQLRKQSDQVYMSITLTDRIDAVEGDMRQQDATFSRLCERHTLPVIDLAKPLQLETVNIPKPWGQEIWYTGIEQRGVCTVQGIPLPWLNAFYPAICANRQRELILLKILDPMPAAVQGDLYFEMHREKTEVYIVTHVDEQCWPNGVGKIRYGFDAAKLAQFESDSEFRYAYLAAVQSYRFIRQQIDAELDRPGREAGNAPNNLITTDLVNHRQDRLPPDWIDAELKLRTEMDAFTHLRDLKVGDVLRVPPFTPHALQHGVRTIEFQTPHYERQIISFAQKVLTQDHWDSIEAIQDMIIQTEQEADLPMLVSDAGVTLEGVADFPQFSVQRLTLQAGARHTFETSSYALTIDVAGECLVNGEQLKSEHAYLVPAYLPTKSIENSSADKAICLLAFPAT